MQRPGKRGRTRPRISSCPAAPSGLGKVGASRRGRLQPGGRPAGETSAGAAGRAARCGAEASVKVTGDSRVIGRLFRARRTARGPGSSRQPVELGGTPRYASGKMESSRSDFQKPHGAQLGRAGEDEETGPAGQPGVVRAVPKSCRPPSQQSDWPDGGGCKWIDLGQAVYPAEGP